MSCEVFFNALKENIDLLSLEEHILVCPDCEKALEEYINFKNFKIENFCHNHNDFLSKFSEEPFDEKIFKESLICSACFKIFSTYKIGFELFKKVPNHKLLKKIKSAPFKDEGIMEKISSIALSLILFFILTFTTITRGNLSLFFTKFQTFYAESKAKTLSFYGKLLGYGANKLKEDKNEMHKPQ